MTNLLPNIFAAHISKTAIQELPLTHFEGEVIIVDHPNKVSESVEYLRQHTILGVDTEARPSFKRGVHYPTALVQVATLERCYLFRLTHVGLPKELADILGVAENLRTVDVQITRLRKKIEADTKNPRYLQTVRGKGYMLISE